MAMYSRHFVQCAKQCDELKINELYKVETFSRTHVSIWVSSENGRQSLKTFTYDYFYDAELYRPYLIDNKFQSDDQPIPTLAFFKMVLVSTAVMSAVIAFLKFFQ